MSGTHWAAIVSSAGSVATACAVIVGGLALREQRQEFRQQRLSAAVVRARRALQTVELVADRHGETINPLEAQQLTDWTELVDTFRDVGARQAVEDLEAVSQSAFMLRYTAEAADRAHDNYQRAVETGLFPGDALAKWNEAKQLRDGACEAAKPVCEQARLSVDSTYRSKRKTRQWAS